MFGDKEAGRDLMSLCDGLVLIDSSTASRFYRDSAWNDDVARSFRPSVASGEIYQDSVIRMGREFAMPHAVIRVEIAAVAALLRNDMWGVFLLHAS